MQAPKKAPANAQPVSVYFDSPLVMDAIGLSGPERADFAQRLLKAFETLRFVALVNDDMLFEIRNNIKALMSTTPSRRYGPTADALRRGEISVEIIQAKIERLEIVVQAAGISIDKSFETHRNKSAITDDLEAELFSRLQSNYQFVEAAERDARTIRGVFGRRTTARPTDLYSARAIFITANDMVTAVANRFFRDRCNYSERNVPVVMARPTIAALTDAVVGVQSGERLSSQELLVSAEEATQYNAEVFEKIETSLRRLDPDRADELLSLLSMTDYSDLAMDLVRGNPRNVSDMAVSDLIATVKKSFEKEAAESVAAARTKERQLAAATTADLNDALSRQRGALDEALRELKGRHQNDIEFILAALGNYRRLLSHIRLGLAVAAAAVALVVGALTFAGTNYAAQLDQNPTLRWVLAVAVGFVAGFPILGLPPVRETLIALVKREIHGRADRLVVVRGFALPMNWMDKSAVAVETELVVQAEAKEATIRGRARADLLE